MRRWGEQHFQTYFAFDYQIFVLIHSLNERFDKRFDCMESEKILNSYSMNRGEGVPHLIQSICKTGHESNCAYSVLSVRACLWTARAVRVFGYCTVNALLDDWWALHSMWVILRLFVVNISASVLQFCSHSVVKIPSKVLIVLYTVENTLRHVANHT